MKNESMIIFLHSCRDGVGQPKGKHDIYVYFVMAKMFTSSGCKYKVSPYKHVNKITVNGVILIIKNMVRATMINMTLIELSKIIRMII